MSPRDLVIRALAQVPLPHKPTVHYHGCFAPNARVRSRVVAAGNKPKGRRRKASEKPPETVEQACTRLAWADALKRAFLYEVLNCPCGGRRRIVAAVQDRREIERFLRHLCLWHGPEDVTAIRGPPEWFDVPPEDAEAPEDWAFFDPPEDTDEAA